MSDLDFRATTRAIREKRSTAEAKALSIGLVPGGFVTELYSYNATSQSSADTATLMSTMQRNELVYACVAIKATAARDPRLIVQQQVSAKGKITYQEVPGHPLRQLIMRPNERMTEGDLTRAAIVSWDISNPRRFYAEKKYTNGLLTALYPLNPACMKPIPSRTPPYATLAYEWHDGQARRQYSLDELLIRSAPSWYDPPPLVAALGATESDSAQTDYIRMFFENGGVPPGLLTYDRPLNDTQRDEIRDKWRTRYGNRFGRSHDVGVLDVNATWQETGATLDKLASQTLRSVAESRICMVFGVPPLIVYAYVGLLRATYSNLKEAWAGFWDATMSPTFKELRDFWTWSLLTEYESEADIRSERIKLAYDMSTVAALQDDLDAMQNRARSNFLANGISRNEYRAAIGYPSRPGDDNVFAKDTAPAPAPVVAPVPPKARSSKARTRGSVQATERKMEKAVEQYLKREYAKAAQAVA